MEKYGSDINQKVGLAAIAHDKLVRAESAANGDWTPEVEELFYVWDRAYSVLTVEERLEYAKLVAKRQFG